MRNALLIISHAPPKFTHIRALFSIKASRRSSILWVLADLWKEDTGETSRISSMHLSWRREDYSDFRLAHVIEPAKATDSSSFLRLRTEQLPYQKILSVSKGSKEDWTWYDSGIAPADFETEPLSMRSIRVCRYHAQATLQYLALEFNTFLSIARDVWCYSRNGKPSQVFEIHELALDKHRASVGKHCQRTSQVIAT